MMVFGIRPRFRFLGIGALACLLALSVPLKAASADLSDGILNIETIGSAPVDANNPTRAEQTAITNALSLAIDQAVTAVLPSELLAANFEAVVAAFHGEPGKFVQNYKTLAVARGEDDTRVLVRSSIPAETVRNRIKQIGIVADGKLSPRLLVLSHEDRSAAAPPTGQTSILSDLENQMRQDFTRRGLAPVPSTGPVPAVKPADASPAAHDQAALAVARQLGADFVVVASLSTPAAGGAGGDRGSLITRLLDVDNGSMISSATLPVQSADAALPSEAVDALATARKEAVRRLAPIIINVFEQQKTRARTIQLRVQSSGHISDLHIFRNYLETMDGIRRSQINEMKADAAVISVDYTGNARQLARMLETTPPDSLSVVILEVLENSLVIGLNAVGGGGN